MRLPISIIIGATLAFTAPAQAHKHHRRHHVVHHYRQDGYHPPGTIVVSSAAGPITVASSAAYKFVGLIADLWRAGFRGYVHCAALGHMPHSLHHTGNACDFGQTGRNRVAPGATIMYRAGSLIAKWGLRDGCSFRDCGHVDTGLTVARHRRPRHHQFASH